MLLLLFLNRDGTSALGELSKDLTAMLPLVNEQMTSMVKL